MLAGLAFGSEIKRFGRSRMTRAAIVIFVCQKGGGLARSCCWLRARSALMLLRC
jgi:hypothetical protein